MPDMDVGRQGASAVWKAKGRRIHAWRNNSLGKCLAPGPHCDRREFVRRMVGS